MAAFRFILFAASLCVACANATWAQGWPLLNSVEVQPLSAQVERVAQALELAGAPLTKEQQASLQAALYTSDAKGATEKIQNVLDPLCLIGVEINPESRVNVQVGPAPKTLQEQGDCGDNRKI